MRQGVWEKALAKERSKNKPLLIYDNSDPMDVAENYILPVLKNIGH